MTCRLLGLSQFAFGRKIHTDADNVRKWEHGLTEPPQEMLAKIQQIAAPLVGKPLT
jgi:DNA-binding transcriptional regulator YiaG